METICMKHQILFSGKNKNEDNLHELSTPGKIRKISPSAELAQGGVRINVQFYQLHQAKLTYCIQPNNHTTVCLCISKLLKKNL